MVTRVGSTTFESLDLDCGVTLAPVECAFETYGELNEKRNNAIMVSHAFSGDAHAAGEGGWWSNMIGPGLAFDTDKYFVICSNVLGGCRGLRDRDRSIRKHASRGPWGFRRSPSRIWCGSRRSWSISGDRETAVGDRRIDGRDAGARVGGDVSGSRGVGDSDRDDGSAQRAADRLQRSGAAGDHGGSGLVRRELLQRTASGARAGGGSHGGAHHLHERRQHAREVRAQAAVAGSVRGRELFEVSRVQIRRPLRREFLHLHHAGDGYVRPVAARGRCRPCSKR